MRTCAHAHAGTRICVCTYARVHKNTQMCPCSVASDLRWCACVDIGGCRCGSSVRVDCRVPPPPQLLVEQLVYHHNCETKRKTRRPQPQRIRNRHIDIIVHEVFSGWRD